MAPAIWRRVEKMNNSGRNSSAGGKEGNQSGKPGDKTRREYILACDEPAGCFCYLTRLIIVKSRHIIRTKTCIIGEIDT